MIIVERKEEIKNIKGDYKIAEDGEIVKILREGGGEIITEEEFLKRMEGKMINIIYEDKNKYYQIKKRCSGEEIRKLINVAEASIFYNRGDGSYSWWYIVAEKDYDKVKEKIRSIMGGGKNDNS